MKKLDGAIHALNPSIIGTVQFIDGISYVINIHLRNKLVFN